MTEKESSFVAVLVLFQNSCYRLVIGRYVWSLYMLYIVCDMKVLVFTQLSLCWHFHHLLFNNKQSQNKGSTKPGDKLFSLLCLTQKGWRDNCYNQINLF